MHCRGVILVLCATLNPFSFAQSNSGVVTNPDAVPRRISPAIGKVTSEDILDSVLEIKRTAELNDKLLRAGEESCRWGLATIDGSDVEKAISQFLLNRGSTVPNTISASEMLRVRSTVSQIAHQLAMGVLMCALRANSDGASTVFGSGKSVLLSMLDAEVKFDGLTCRQAIWEERSNFRGLTSSEALKRLQGDRTGEVDIQRILGAARELKAAAETAERVSKQAVQTKGCQLRDSPTPELETLDEVINHIEHSAIQSPKITASEMRCTTLIAPAAQLSIWNTMLACLPSKASKKKTQTIEQEALKAYDRLFKASSAFDSLTLQQEEWEESSAFGLGVIDEQ